jgi:hypothetical protein
MGEQNAVKLAVISRSPNHGGILASQDENILGYSAVYDGWAKNTEALKLFHAIEKGELNPWYSERVKRGKTTLISTGFFVGAVMDVSDVNYDMFQVFVDTEFMNGRNSYLKGLMEVYHKFTYETKDRKDHVSEMLRGYAKAIANDLEDMLPPAGMTMRMNLQVPKDSALDLLFRSARMGGRIDALRTVTGLVGKYMEHEHLRKKDGTNGTYEQFVELREKIASAAFEYWSEDPLKIGLLAVEDSFTLKDGLVRG